jgi:hypothetical protein
MVKRAIFIATILLVGISLAGIGLAAEPAKKPAAPPQQPGQIQRPNFSMTTGTVTKIDNSDPANIKVEIKDEKDGSTKTYSVLPWTNITKVIGVTDLKSGETVRVMSRSAGNNNIAMGIMSGKIKIPAGQVKAAQPAAQAKKK